MEIIPAIDIIEGKCVRLTQGNYGQCKVYSDSPLEVAIAFEAIGLKRLHLVDLDGAKAARVVNHRILEIICRQTHLSVDFGGGIKSEDDLCRVFEAGADYACVGSIAQSDPEKVGYWLDKYECERLIIGADVWNTKICIQGWKKVTDTTVYQLVENYRGKVRNLMCTDITRDGMLSGPSLGLYRDLLVHYPDIQLIASGGIRNMDDLYQLACSGIRTAVVGKAIYEKKIDLKKCVQETRKYKSYD